MLGFNVTALMVALPMVNLNRSHLENMMKQEHSENTEPPPRHVIISKCENPDSFVCVCVCGGGGGGGGIQAVIQITHQL